MSLGPPGRDARATPGGDARHGKRPTTSRPDFVNPQCGRVHTLWSLQRLRSSRVRRHGEPSSGVHESAPGCRGLSGRNLVGGRTARLAARCRRVLPGVGPRGPRRRRGDGLDRPRHPAPPGASPVGGAARGGRPRAGHAGDVGGPAPVRPPPRRGRRRPADRRAAAGPGPVRRARPAGDRRPPHRGRDGSVRVRGPAPRARDSSSRRRPAVAAPPRPASRRPSAVAGRPRAPPPSRSRVRPAGTVPRATAAVTGRPTPGWSRSSRRPRGRRGRRRAPRDGWTAPEGVEGDLLTRPMRLTDQSAQSRRPRLGGSLGV